MNPEKIILRYIFCVLLAGLAASMPSDTFAQRKGRIQVLYEMDGSNSNLSALQKNGLVYVSLGEFAELIGVRTFYNPDNKKMVLRAGSKEIKVTAFNPYIL